MEEMDRYYQILSLKSGASKEEVIEAYKDLLMKWHAYYKSHDTETIEIMAKEMLENVEEAYIKLMFFIERSEKVLK
jgi:DnaJ-class molecular chaperone